MGMLWTIITTLLWYLFRVGERFGIFVFVVGMYVDESGDDGGVGVLFWFLQCKDTKLF